MSKFKLPIILFDDECTMCLRFKQALEHMDSDKLIHFHSVNDDEIYTAFSFLNKEKCLDRVHLIDEKKQVHIGAEIIQVLKEKIPMIGKISWLLEKEATKKALNFFYDKVNELKKSKINPCPGCKKK